MRRILALFLLSLSISISTIEIGFAETRQELEQELANLESQIKSLSENISEKQKQGTSLKNDISVLTQKISESKLKIQLHSKAIKRLSETISEKNLRIGELDAKLGREKESLAQIMRKTKLLDEYTLPLVILQSKSFSEVFEDADTFASVNRALNQSFDDITMTRGDLEEVKGELLEAKDEETEKKIAQEREKKKVESNQKEKSTLLQITKNQEAEFKKVLVDRQKEASKIRARLFELRDAASISFGQAYDLAVLASRGTGVRPALILSILMQESSLGINVGACYLKDTQTGDGVSIKNGTLKPRTMSPTRDVGPFTDLLNRIGRDMTKTPVSCWIPMYSRGNPMGWGGAMGPSQFIPSTWKLFENRIEGITGASVADPWNPKDAITATALYLADLGASSGNESSERNAACKYYSGRSCAAGTGASYGNSVMRRIDAIQADIDKLQR